MSQLHSLQWNSTHATSPLDQVLAAASCLTRLELPAVPAHKLVQLSCLPALRHCAIRPTDVVMDMRHLLWPSSFDGNSSLHVSDLAWTARLWELRLNTLELTWEFVADVAAAGHWSALRCLHLSGTRLFPVQPASPGQQPASLVCLDHLTSLHVHGRDDAAFHSSLISSLERWRLPALAVLEVSDFDGPGSPQQWLDKLLTLQLQLQQAANQLQQQRFKQAVRQVVPSLARIGFSSYR
jgi:hypothetical protein